MMWQSVSLNVAWVSGRITVVRPSLELSLQIPSYATISCYHYFSHSSMMELGI
jgi:hypothetical protein